MYLGDLMRRTLLAIGLGLLLMFVVFSSGCTNEDKKKKVEKENEIVMMTYQEHMDDWGRHIDNESHVMEGYLKSLDEGDTLKINDTIVFTSYGAEEDIMSICFKCDSAYAGFSFRGDLTKKFQIGDRVIITLHIIYVVYEKDFGDTTWLIKSETFKEMNDEITHETKPLLESCIELVS